MDEDNAELIDLLCTRIGSIMEDASAIALTVGRLPAEERRARIKDLQHESARILAMTAALSSLS